MDQHKDPDRQTTAWSLLSRRRDATRGSSDTNRDPKGPCGLSTISDALETAIADLIFVHGLGGGSRSTWTKDSDPDLFWPQEWLLQDAKFQDVRIHSFGYDSNWREESILDISDFAKSLLASIQHCPAIPKDSKAPLIFIGHSMGGLVIKRAYILAKQIPDFEFLAQRVRAIYFLATPHRGADSAMLLTKILNIAGGGRPFVRDLHPNSFATQSINDEFPQHCKDLQLYSFYETIPMSYGFGKGIIVEKDSAVLGYPNERTAYVSANHRDICKFSTSTDSNYLAIRNALASTIEGFRTSHTSSNRLLNNKTQQLLENFLGISDAPEDDLLGFDVRRMRGSCEWLTEKRGFRDWQEPKNADAHLYWISAKPATGKSVLSGFIVKYLRDMNQDCSFYFFNYSNQSQSTIGYFLRSIAWQMAMKHPNILRTIIDISYKDDQLAKADFRSLWRKLFLDGILGVKLDRPQYWVVDALDECRGEVELIPLLLKVSELCRIRIVVTCRNNYESYSLISNSMTKVVSEEILQDDTSRDIALYMKAHVDLLPAADEETQQIMVATILTKSAGCFLWVDLVLKELKQIHSSAEVFQVLEEVPSDMDELYSRILDSMSNARYSKHLAKAILTWTVCSARPLTTDELYHAIQLDIKDTIDKIEKSIAACCGQLVYVDSQQRVHMVHQTAREFLLRRNITSEFAIEKKTGHQRLGITCIEYLAGEEMRAPRQWKLGVSSVHKIRSPFANYACTSLSEHISHVSSEDSDFLTSLAGLLCSSNILAWIEFLAQNSNLRCVIQTGKALRRYLQKRAHFVLPIGAEVEILDSWATDLVRLVIKFGPNLAASPGSIFNLIPPFCPSNRAPRKLFAASTRGMSVLGLSATDWDDCLSTITHYQTTLTSLACSDKHFAVGMNTGKVVVYHEMTCQEAQVLQHGEHLRILQFGKMGNVIASGGMKNVRLWDVDTWQQIWQLDIAQECMSLQFTDEDKMLLGASRSNCLMIWDLTTGELTNDPNWTHNLQGASHHGFRRPIFASICVESGLLAVVYRGRDIILWDIEEEQLHETCGKETGGQNYVNGGLVFGQDTSVGLLAASYSDGDLVVFDVDKGTIKETTLANASSLACSPDGLTLASADALGTIQLFDFESLKLLYRINSDWCGVKALAFSTNNHRLLDIRGSECRVWDPAILIREDINEEISDTISMSTAPVEISLESSEDIILITSVACHEGGEVFFCGREDGSIYMHETTDGSSNQKLLGHASGVSIVSLHFDSGSEMLISVDSSSRVMMHKLGCKNGVWRASKPSFDLRVGVAVEQVLSNRESGRILICSSQKASLYSVTEDESTAVETLSWENHQHGRWGTQYDRKLDERQLVQILDNTAHLYDWQTLRKLTDANGILLKGISPELSIRSINPCANTSIMATTFGESLQSNSRPQLLFWNAADLSINASSASADPRYQYLRDQVQLLIGSHRRRLIFLHHSGWICSANLDVSKADQIVRHFFVPNDWLSAGVQLMIEVTCNGDIIFVKRHEAAVIKRGLEISDQLVSVAERKKPSMGKRPSFAGRRSQGSGSLEIPRPPGNDTRPPLVGSGSLTPDERLEQNLVYSGRNSPAMISPRSPRGRLQTPNPDKTFLDLSPTRNQLSGL